MRTWTHGTGRASSTVSNCPQCSKPMTPGFLGSESFVGGSKWFLERTRMAFGGEEIAKPNTFGMVYIPGFRCRDCRTMVLQY
jgi:Domain of unknown function (DUF6487)